MENSANTQVTNTETTHIINEWKKAFPEIDEIRINLALIRNGYLPEEQNPLVIKKISKRHAETKGGIFDVERKGNYVHGFFTYYRPKSLSYLGKTIRK